jgi:hypothetical protein
MEVAVPIFSFPPAVPPVPVFANVSSAEGSVDIT